MFFGWFVEKHGLFMRLDVNWQYLCTQTGSVRSTLIPTWPHCILSASLFRLNTSKQNNKFWTHFYIVVKVHSRFLVRSIHFECINCVLAQFLKHQTCVHYNQTRYGINSGRFSHWFNIWAQYVYSLHQFNFCFLLQDLYCIFKIYVQRHG